MLTNLFPKYLLCPGTALAAAIDLNWSRNMPTSSTKGTTIYDPGYCCLRGIKEKLKRRRKERLPLYSRVAFFHSVTIRVSILFAAKPGQCTRTNTWRCNGNVKDDCSYDVHCPGTMKCCPTTANPTSCKKVCEEPAGRNCSAKTFKPG